MADAANAGQLSPDSVAACLADPATRLATLSALEAHTGRHDAAVSLAAAPTLVDLQCMEASEVDRAAACTYGRGGIGLGWSVGRDRERQNACQAAASQARTALIVL